ncbi:MAG: hypothetical protein ABWY82_01770 [Tardiphaga sp.]
MKRTSTTRREIQSFAVQYQAFCEATRDGDRRGQLLWGKLLHESQESLGIRLASLDSEFFAILQRAL